MMNTIDNISNNCISQDLTLMDALNRLEESKPKVLFAVDSDNRLTASITDGDIRRAILSGVALDCVISDFARKDPFFVRESECEECIPAASIDLIKKRGLSAVPVIDESGRIVKIITDFSPKKVHRESIDVPVVIMAGGKGTRLYPYTKILPKPLIPVDDIPISERIIQSLREAGCNEFHMKVNYRKEIIKAYYAENERDYNIIFHDEDKPLGTGGGLKLIEDKISGTFVMTNCDILIMEDLANIIRLHRKEGNKATMVCSLKNFEIPYGIVKMTDTGDIDSFEEKPRMSFFTNTGYYVLERDVFDHIGRDEHIGMPDIIGRMKEAGLKVGVYPIGENSWLDMGQFDSMESMEAYLRDKD